MIWALLLFAACYLVFAWLIAELGYSIVGESPAGKQAVPVVAALWPLAIAFLVIVGIGAIFDFAVARSLERTFGRDSHW